MAKTVIRRVITAGPLVMEAIYPAARPRDGPAQRQGRQAVSSRARQLLNLKAAWQRLMLLIAANFGPGDIFATLTYSDSRLPDTREGVKRDVRAFVARLRKARRGLDLRYIYVIEHRHGEGRWHVHFLINSTGNDYGLIRLLWGNGGVEFRKIRVDREKNYETLARYLCKERRDGEAKPGQRAWSCSLNLRKPKREFFRVSEGTVLRPPPKKERAMVLFQEAAENRWGSFRYLEYVRLRDLPGAPRARRRN